MTRVFVSSPVLEFRSERMKPSLFRSASTIRPEECLECEVVETREWMVFNEERTVDAVELDGFSEQCVDEARMSKHRCWEPANPVEPIKRPHF